MNLNRSDQLESSESIVIAIVDDSEDFRFLLKEQIGAKYPAFQIVSFENGDIFMEYLKILKTSGNQSQYPDLVLLDMSMPLMDGVEVLQEMKKDSSLEKIPVIALTGRAEFKEKALKMGVDQFVDKPNGGDVLGKVVKVLMGNWLNTLGGDFEDRRETRERVEPYEEVFKFVPEAEATYSLEILDRSDSGLGCLCRGEKVPTVGMILELSSDKKYRVCWVKPDPHLGAKLGMVSI